MNLDQQNSILSVLINEFLATHIETPEAISTLESWKRFPLRSCPLFIKILQESCKRGKLDIVKYFKENYPHTLDQPNVRGETPLFFATSYNHLDIAKFLIDNGASLETMTCSGDTYLHWLVCVPQSTEKTKLIEEVLNKNVQLATTKNMCNETPLHYAALVGDLPLCEKLLDCGCKVTDKTTRSINVYEYSLVSGNVELIEMMKDELGEPSYSYSSPAPSEAEKETTEEGAAPKPKSTALRNRRARAAAQRKAGADASSSHVGSSELADLESMESQLQQSMIDHFKTGTTLSDMYDKFQQYKFEKPKGWKKLEKSAKKSEAEFRNAMIMLMQKHFVSKRMIETPNNFGRGKKYRILSLDGGGIKVIIELIILQRLLSEFPDLLEKVNLFCGCSASSFIVSMLSMGVSIEGVIELMENLFKVGFKKVPVPNVTQARYTNEYLIAFSQAVFGHLRVKDLPRHIAIPAFMIDSLDKVDHHGHRYCKCETFNNILKGENDTELIADICVRSASAPTFFKPYQNYVDGGIIDNQPVGITFPYLFGDQGLKLKRSNVVCLSLSAGKPPRYVDSEKLGGAGVAQWALQMTDMFLGSRRNESVKESQMMFGDKYLRVEPTLPGAVTLDDAEELEEIRKIAYNYNLEPIRKWLRENWD